MPSKKTGTGRASLDEVTPTSVLGERLTVSPHRMRLD